MSCSIFIQRLDNIIIAEMKNANLKKLIGGKSLR